MPTILWEYRPSRTVVLEALLFRALLIRRRFFRRQLLRGSLLRGQAGCSSAKTTATRALEICGRTCGTLTATNYKLMVYPKRN